MALQHCIHSLEVLVVLEKDGEHQLDRPCEKSQGGEGYSKIIKINKVNFIGHILCRNCLLKHVIEGKIEGRIEVTARRGRRCKQLLDHLNGCMAVTLCQKVIHRAEGVKLGLGWGDTECGSSIGEKMFSVPPVKADRLKDCVLNR
jgi:hypothetical protein